MNNQKKFSKAAIISFFTGIAPVTIWAMSLLLLLGNNESLINKIDKWLKYYGTYYVLLNFIFITVSIISGSYAIYSIKIKKNQFKGTLFVVAGLIFAIGVFLLVLFLMLFGGAMG